MKYQLQNYITKEIVIWSVAEILEEINRDRSESFQPYDETDWKEGLSLTDYELITEV